MRYSLRAGESFQVEAEAQAPTSIANGGPDIVYYGTSSVSSSSYVGSIASGASVTITTSRNLVSAGRSVLEIEFGSESVVVPPSQPDLYVRRSRNPFNVMDYGALGDGETADNVAVQAAIDAAHDAYVASDAQQTVFFPAGRYYLPAVQMYRNWEGKGFGRFTGITLKDGVRLKANRDAVLYQDYGSSVLGGASPGDTVFFESILWPGQTGQANFWAIDGLIFEGDGEAGDPEINGEIIGMSACEDWEIVNCIFRNHKGDGILTLGDGTNNSKRFRVNYNIFERLAGQGFINAAGAGLYIEDAELIGNRATDCLTVAECLILGGDGGVKRAVVADNNVSAWGTALTLGYGAEDVTVSGNTFIQAPVSSGGLLAIQSGARISITGNTLDSGLATGAAGSNASATVFAIREQAVEDLTISGNSCRVGRGFGILGLTVSGTHKRWAITGNVFDTLDTAGDGVASIRSTEDCIFADNVCRGAGPNSVSFISGSVGQIITGNDIDGQVTANRAQVTGNRIKYEHTSSAALTVGEKSSVIGNRIASGGGNIPTIQIGANSSEVIVQGNVLVNTKAGAGALGINVDSGTSYIWALDNMILAPNGSLGGSGDGIGIGAGTGSLKRVPV